MTHKMEDLIAKEILRRVWHVTLLLVVWDFFFLRGRDFGVFLVSQVFLSERNLHFFFFEKRLIAFGLFGTSGNLVHKIVTEEQGKDLDLFLL
jgi:hypothetical protein